MPSSSSAKRAGSSEAAPPFKSKQSNDMNKYQTLASMDKTINNNNQNQYHLNFQQQHHHHQQQSMSPAMLTNHYLHQSGQRNQSNYPLGSQTISRSNNLHKQYYSNNSNNNNHSRGSIYAQQAAATAAAAGYYFYDQPNYQSAGQMYPIGQHHRVPYAPMSLAVRSPKERGAIPMGLQPAPPPPLITMNNGHFTQTLGRPSSSHLKHQQQQVIAKDSNSNSTLPLPSFASARLIYQEPTVNLIGHLDTQARLNKPLCRCRVMYLGSSVPHITKNGLHGIQEPLRHLYPEEQFNSNNLRTTTTTSQATISEQQSFPTTGSTTSGGGGGGGNGSGSGGQPIKINNTIDISHLSSSLGIDSWLSVWSNGLLLENVDEFGREMRRFYSIESLHYCAAVRFFDTATLMKQQNSSPSQQQQHHHQVGNDNNNNEITNSANSNQCDEALQSAAAAAAAAAIKSDANNNTGSGNFTSSPTAAAAAAAADSNGSSVNKRGVVRFLPLDAPIFQYPGMLDANHPPVFAAIMRRTSGIKVLECHAFICRRDAAANALVRCCTHAYSDFLSAKRLSADFGFLQQQQLSAYIGNSGTNAFVARMHSDSSHHHQTQSLNNTGHARRFRSTSAGRHLTRHQRAPLPLDNGQYQVIDAIVHDGAIKSRKSKTMATTAAAAVGAAGHRNSNSTGTNSNELTHSDDNDLNSRDGDTDTNDDDNDDEDNYAIITKLHKQQQQKQHQQHRNQNQNNLESRAESGGSRMEDNATARGSRDKKTRATAAAAARRRAARKVKGSSKSLFDDFMPQKCGPALLLAAAPNTASNQLVNPFEADLVHSGGRLSHSLDYLSLIAANQTGPAAGAAAAVDPALLSKPGSKRSNKKSSYHKSGHNSTTAAAALGDDTSITYSVVSHKHRSKRHSKSMQDLKQIPAPVPVASVQEASQLQQQQQPLNLNWPELSLSSSLRRKESALAVGKYQPHFTANHHQQQQQDLPICGRDDRRRIRRANQQQQQQRRAASYQDILRQAPPPPPPPRDSPPSSNFNSLQSHYKGASRSSSVRSSFASSKTGSRSKQTSGQTDARSHKQQGDQSRKCSLISSSTSEANNRIYATCDTDTGPTVAETDPRTLRPDYCATNAMTTDRRAPASGHKSRSRQKQHQQQQPIEVSNGYYQHDLAATAAAATPTHSNLFCGPLCSPTPPHQAPLYMPAYYMPADHLHAHSHHPLPVPVPVQQGSLYAGAGSIYDTITPPPGTAYVSPGAYHQHHSGQYQNLAAHQQHQQLQLALHQQQLAASYTMSGAPPLPMPPPQMIQDERAAPLSTSKSARKKSLGKKSATSLATRFRCLSPPLNFFASSSSAGASTKHAAGTTAESSVNKDADLARPNANNNYRPISIESTDGALQVSSRQQQQQHFDRSQEAQNSEMTPNASDSNSRCQLQPQQQQRQSIASSTGRGDGDRDRDNDGDASTSTSSGLVSPSEVVSGQPGFVSQRQAGGELTLKGTSAATATASASAMPIKRDKGARRMSWIKRLSLSLSSGGFSSSAGPQVVVGDPNGVDSQQRDNFRCEASNGGGELAAQVRQAEVAGSRAAATDGHAVGAPKSSVSYEFDLSESAEEAAANRNAIEALDCAGPVSDSNNSEPNRAINAAEAHINVHNQLVEAAVSSELNGDNSKQQQQQQQQQEKAKRKRGSSLFSGVLTLGRSSGAKQTKDKKPSI